jgi:hypothetical protein
VIPGSCQVISCSSIRVKVPATLCLPDLYPRKISSSAFKNNNGRSKNTQRMPSVWEFTNCLLMQSGASQFPYLKNFFIAVVKVSPFSLCALSRTFDQRFTSASAYSASSACGCFSDDALVAVFSISLAVAAASDSLFNVDSFLVNYFVADSISDLMSCTLLVSSSSMVYFSLTFFWRYLISYYCFSRID